MSSKITVKELHAECKAKGIKGYSRMRKAELLKVCRKKKPTRSYLEDQCKRKCLPNYKNKSYDELSDYCMQPVDENLGCDVDVGYYASKYKGKVKTGKDGKNYISLPFFNVDGTARYQWEPMSNVPVMLDIKGKNGKCEKQTCICTKYNPPSKSKTCATAKKLSKKKRSYVAGKVYAEKAEK